MQEQPRPSDPVEGSETTPTKPAATPSEPAALDLHFSIGSPRPLAADLFPPEMVERLRAGGTPTADDLDRLRAAAAADGGLIGKVMENLLAAGFTERSDAASPDASNLAGPAGDARVRSIPIGSRTFTWSSDGVAAPPTDPNGSGAVTEPATYYEALTGRPDPMRGFFVTARRVLNAIVWVIALAIPIGLVALGIVNGEASDTIVFMGIGGLIVGLMIRYSFPRTPFG